MSAYRRPQSPGDILSGEGLRRTRERDRQYQKDLRRWYEDQERRQQGMESAQRQAIEDERKAREHEEDREEKRLTRAESKLRREENARLRAEAEKGRAESGKVRTEKDRLRGEALDKSTRESLVRGVEQEAAEVEIEEMTGFSVDEALEFLKSIPGGEAAIAGMGGLTPDQIGPAVVQGAESIRGAGEAERQRLQNELEREGKELTTQQKYETMVKDYVTQNFGKLETYDKEIEYPALPEDMPEDEVTERVKYQLANPTERATRFVPNPTSPHKTYEEALAAAEEAVQQFYQATMQQQPRMTTKRRVEEGLRAQEEAERWDPGQRAGAAGSAPTIAEPTIDQAKLEKIEALLQAPGVSGRVKEQLMAERDRLLGGGQ